MYESLSAGEALEQEKELMNILIDSDLYLDMELVERNRLLHFPMVSYLRCAAHAE